jgi:hypothetical protein
MVQELERSPQAYRHIAELKNHILRQRVMLKYVLDTGRPSDLAESVPALLRSIASESSNDYLTIPVRDRVEPLRSAVFAFSFRIPARPDCLVDGTADVLFHRWCDLRSQTGKGTRSRPNRRKPRAARRQGERRAWSESAST